MSHTSRGVERCRLLWEGNPWVNRYYRYPPGNWENPNFAKGKSSTQYCFSGRDMLVPRKVQRRDLYLFAPTRSLASGIPTKPWLRSSLCVFSLVQRKTHQQKQPLGVGWIEMFKAHLAIKYLLHSPKKVLLFIKSLLIWKTPMFLQNSPAEVQFTKTLATAELGD